MMGWGGGARKCTGSDEGGRELNVVERKHCGGTHHWTALDILYYFGLKFAEGERC